MTCAHLSSLRSPEGVRRVSLAAENVFCSVERPCVGSSAASTLRCVAPRCTHPASGDLHVCVQCVFTACNNHGSRVLGSSGAHRGLAVDRANHMPQRHASSVGFGIRYREAGGGPVMEDHEVDSSHMIVTDGDGERLQETGHLSHLSRHDSDVSHPISLSVDHGRLYCCRCDDFVYDVYLDAAVELQRLMATSRRRNFVSTPSPLDRGAVPISIGTHALLRSRTKRRRVVAVDFWAPTDAELALIDSHSSGRLRKPPAVCAPVGLYNLGNSCYMSSVLQAFLNAPPLRCFFLGDGHRTSCTRLKTSSDCLACALDSLVCDSYYGEIASEEASDRTFRALPVSHSPNASPQSAVAAGRHGPFLVPQRVLEIVWKNAEHLASYAQHDAHEFLIAALNILNAHCRRKPGAAIPSGLSLSRGDTAPSPSHRSTSRSGMARGRDSSKSSSVPVASSRMPTSPVANMRGTPNSKLDDMSTSSLSSHQEHTIVHNLFSGTLQSDVICRVCGNRSPTLEKFYDISLDVDNVAKPDSSTRRSRACSPATSVGRIVAPTDNSSSRQRHGDVVSRNLFTSPDNSHGMAAAFSNSQSSDFKNGCTPAGSPASTELLAAGPRESGELDAANSLAECLARFTEPEILGESAKMDCARCGIRQEAMKQMSIRSLPPVLCFHFKRFEQNFAKVRRSEMVKIDTPVEFPLDNLDLTDFQTSSVSRKRALHGKSESDSLFSPFTCPDTDFPVERVGDASVREGVSDAVYDLFAVVNHSGKIDRGHYTTLIRRRGSWFNCDDEKVTPAAPVGEVLRSEKAYLLFYTQRKPNLVY